MLQAMADCVTYQQCIIGSFCQRQPVFQDIYGGHLCPYTSEDVQLQVYFLEHLDRYG